MKKLAILLIIGLAVGTTAMAQTNDVKKDQKVLKSSVKDKKEDKQEVNRDLTHLRVKKAARKHREVRRHSKSIHRQGEHLERHGVKHPVKKARQQVKADKDARKGKD